MKKVHFAALIIITALLILPAKVLAYCSTPSAPNPPSTFHRPSKPSAPYCVNTFSNTHTCSQWEINNYKSELQQYRFNVEDYIRKLKNYVREANRFANETVSYANCEIRNIE